VSQFWDSNPKKVRVHEVYEGAFMRFVRFVRVYEVYEVYEDWEGL